MSLLSFKSFFRKSRFVLGEQASEAPVTLNHRRIFILPTARGMGFALLLLVLLLIAFVYNNNMVYLLTFWLASIFFISILHCFKSLAGLVVQEGYCQSVYAGEAVGFVIYITNPTHAARTDIMVVKQQQPERLTIKPKSKVRAVVYSTTQTRGWHEAGTITVSSTYPLGLFRAWSPVRFNLKALVYPKPSKLHMPFPETASAHAQEGSGRKGDDDFYGFREYHAGDSRKRIHWKAFAKGQGLFTKHYAGESPAQVWLNYEDAPGQNVEERLSQLCRWVIDADEAGITYGFSLPGLRLAPDCGERHRQKCLEALALF
ncbi:MAG: DUF58 domain-containing protein [Methylosarcina sp.]